jgi:hypothetical protein
MHRYESTDWYHGCWLISTKPKQASFNTKKAKGKAKCLARRNIVIVCLWPQFGVYCPYMTVSREL